jgi:hypothetical protein
LVASYERLIQARGQEIKEQDIRESLPEMAKTLENNNVSASDLAKVSDQLATGTVDLLPKPRPVIPPRTTVRTHLANRGAGVAHQALFRLVPRLEPGRRNIWSSHHKVTLDAPERQSSHP